MAIRHARHILSGDFKTGSFVITGSPISNPWTTLFDTSLNFQFETNPVPIRNPKPAVKPAAGEAAFFEIKSGGSDSARIAMMPNLGGAGFVLRIAGIEDEGMDGSGDFLLRADAPSKLRTALGLGANDKIPNCEFILEVRTPQRAAQSAEIIAARRR